MNNAKNILFFPGMGEKPRHYEDLSKYMTIADIDWNTDKYKPKIGKQEILIGFSLGNYYPLTYASKHHVKTLVLCSLTPLETLKGIKADKIIFLVGSKEKFVLDNVKRVAKELKTSHEIIVIPGGDHKISGAYKKKLLEVVSTL